MRMWTERLDPEPDPGTTTDSWRNWPITFFIVDERTDDEILEAALGEAPDGQ